MSSITRIEAPFKRNETICYTPCSLRAHGETLKQALDDQLISEGFAFQSLRRAIAFYNEQETQGNLDLPHVLEAQ